MKKGHNWLILVVMAVSFGCEGGIDDKDQYNTDGIEECETNGRCGGCCSHHGGIACRDGVTVCWDGSPLSNTCRQKGCSGCVGCGDLSTCELYLDDKEDPFLDPLYVDVTFKKNQPAKDKFFGPKGWVMIDLAATTLTITLKIYPYHAIYQGDGCRPWEQASLGLYFEARCDGCDEIVEWIQDSCYYEELRFPFRPRIYFEPIGEGIIGPTSLCGEFGIWPWCIDDETGSVSGWLFFPEDPSFTYGGDEYSYSDIKRLRFESFFSNSGDDSNIIGYIDMFELR